MSYLEAQRPLPPWPRLLLASCLAPLVPSAVLLLLLTWDENVRQVAASLPLLAFLVGQSLILAIPLVLVRWRAMQHPLLECLLIGALSAPGLLGYLGLATVFAYAPGPVAAIWLILAGLGTVGGACFWAVATNLGDIADKQ